MYYATTFETITSMLETIEKSKARRYEYETDLLPLWAETRWWSANGVIHMQAHYEGGLALKDEAQWCRENMRAGTVSAWYERALKAWIHDRAIIAKCDDSNMVNKVSHWLPSGTISPRQSGVRETFTKWIVEIDGATVTVVAP